MKNYSKSSDISVFTLPKRVELITEKLIAGRRKMRNPSLNIICTVYWFKYKTLSHFDDLVLAWPAYLKYLYSFK